MDVDFLLHIVGFCGIYYNIKNIQENASKTETKFKGGRTDTFQVCYMKTRSKWSLDKIKIYIIKKLKNFNSEFRFNIG